MQSGISISASNELLQNVVGTNNTYTVKARILNNKTFQVPIISIQSYAFVSVSIRLKCKI